MVLNTKKWVFAALACVMALMTTRQVLADDAKPVETKPVEAKPELEYGKSAGDIMVRLRGLDVIPRDHGHIVLATPRP